MHPTSDFCSYTKAVEHLGDRWMLLILREVALHGPIGFNALVAGLPGISRSVLAKRLRKLEVMGLIARAPSVRGQPAPYRMAPAGQQLAPTLLSLSQWAERWVPEDPEAANHDPDVITFWLTLRADPERLPERPAVLVFETGDRHVPQQWLVLERGAAPRCAWRTRCCPTSATSTSRPAPTRSFRSPAACATGRPPSRIGPCGSSATRA